jgi:hypothetical protein
MNIKPIDFISGLAIYLLVSVLAGVSIAMRIFPGRFDEWLSESSNPQQALIYFSVIIGGIILIFTRIGVEVNFLNMAKGENFKRYAAGLPLWFLFISIAISLYQFWRFYPPCKAPEAVVFQVIGSSKEYLPFDVMDMSPNESLTIRAKSPDDNTLLSCVSWEFVGPAFQNLGSKNGCQANITFSVQPGTSYITLFASQNFCSQASLFSLEVRIKEP